jgi:ankyrin repeat protein
MREAMSRGNAKKVRRILARFPREFKDYLSYNMEYEVDWEVFNVFVGAGMNVNRICSSGLSTLSEAIHKCNRTMVRYLLEKGADPNIITRGHSPISLCMDYRGHHFHKSVLPALVEHGANPNRVGANGYTDFMLVCRGDVLRETIWTMIEHGANPHIVAEDGTTSLHMAVVGGNWTVIELLVSLAVDVNARAKGGRTPLMNMVRYLTVEILAVFLENRANILLRDDEGMTLYQHMYCEMEEVRQSLRRNMTSKHRCESVVRYLEMLPLSLYQKSDRSTTYMSDRYSDIDVILIDKYDR